MLNTFNVMTKKQFDKRVKEIYNTYGVKTDERSFNNGIVFGYVDTPFGLLRIRMNGGIQYFSMFMQFQEDFDIELFYRYFSRHEIINEHTKKWNLHSVSGEYILGELEERLDNLAYILKNDGKGDVKQYKPILENCDKL